MENLPAQILLQVVFILLNAFFAGSEIAFLSLNPVKLDKQADNGDKTAARLLALVENPNRFLSAIQVAITLSGFLGAAFGTENFSGYLADFLSGLGLPLPAGVVSVFSMVVVTIVISFFSIAFGEMVPKRIAMQQPEAWARMALGVMHGISVVFAPMMALLNVTTNGTLHLLGLKTEAEEAAASEEDIRLMVENSGEQGAIAQEEQKWIENVFDFGDRVASDVMTPEPDVSAFSLDEENDVILETIQKTGLSRYPVYEDNINDVRGVLNARDFLLNLQRQNPCPLESLLRPAYFVPENVHADRLFRDMQAQKHHLAIVVDEYGGTEGLLTMEDILEELVGEIWDEHDEVVESFRKQADGSFLVSAGADLTDLYDLFSIKGDCDASTVSGWVIDQLGRLPQAGDRFQAEGLDVTVTRVDHRRVLEVRVAVAAKEPEPAEAGAEH